MCLTNKVILCQGHKRQLEFLSQENHSQAFYIGKKKLSFLCLPLKSMAAGKYSNVYFLEMLLFFLRLRRK